MRMRTLHEWDLSYARARHLQMELAGRVQVVPLQKEARFVAGLECAFSPDGRRIFAAAVLLEVAGRKGDSFDLRLVETVSAAR